MFVRRYENAFLVSLVGLRPEKYFWTGFANTEDKNTFQWTTRRKVTFTHFNVGMPGTAHFSLAAKYYCITIQFCTVWLAHMFETHSVPIQCILITFSKISCSATTRIRFVVLSKMSWCVLNDCLCRTLISLLLHDNTPAKLMAFALA